MNNPASMAGRRPSHFFKIILPSTIDDKKLVMHAFSLPHTLAACFFVFPFLEYSAAAAACSIVLMVPMYHDGFLGSCLFWHLEITRKRFNSFIVSISGPFLFVQHGMEI
jgi:hypothetical protein